MLTERQPLCCSSLKLYYVLTLSGVQITVFRLGAEGQQDIEMAILTALLKGRSPQSH